MSTTPTLARPICDFCKTGLGFWIHDCGDVEVTLHPDDRRQAGPGPEPYLGVGAWMSCNECLVSIQRGDVRGLMDRQPNASAPARVFLRRLYTDLLPALAPPRPLTPELAARWADAMRDWMPNDEASARRVAASLGAA